MSARETVARSLTRHVAHGVTKDAWRKADLVLSALTAAGYAVVPREPTREMLQAAMDRPLEEQPGEVLYHSIYRAMLAAAEADGFVLVQKDVRVAIEKFGTRSDDYLRGFGEGVNEHHKAILATKVEIAP